MSPGNVLICNTREINASGFGVVKRSSSPNKAFTSALDVRLLPTSVCGHIVSGADAYLCPRLWERSIHRILSPSQFTIHLSRI